MSFKTSSAEIDPKELESCDVTHLAAALLDSVPLQPRLSTTAEGLGLVGEAMPGTTQLNSARLLPADQRHEGALQTTDWLASFVR